MRSKSPIQNIHQIKIYKPLKNRKLITFEREATHLKKYVLNFSHPLCIPNLHFKSKSNNYFVLGKKAKLIKYKFCRKFLFFWASQLANKTKTGPKKQPKTLPFQFSSLYWHWLCFIEAPIIHFFFVKILEAYS